MLVVLALAPVGLRMLSWRTAHEPVDPDMAAVGKMLFQHEWKVHDSLSPSGDGLGPVFNERSCVACHGQGGAGGGGGLKFNVTTFTVRPMKGNTDRSTGVAREGVVHAFAVNFPETLSNVHPRLPAVSQPALRDLVRLNRDAASHCPVGTGGIAFPPGVHISQRNTPALFGAKLIDEIPDQVIVAAERRQRLAAGLAPTQEENAPIGRAMILANGRVGHFGWKAQTASLSDFVQAACANELGLSNPGAAQPKPMSKPDYPGTGYDLTLEQCNQLTAYVASLPRPIERLPADFTGQEKHRAGKELFTTVGCAACHLPQLGGIEGLYSDLLLHRMGQTLEGGGSYGEPPLPQPELPSGDGQLPDEWRTPPLWGVADSAPYMHDGRAGTLELAIQMHGGQASQARDRFANLTGQERVKMLAFLKSLRAPGQ
jgi:CxxC motif-containing protein (DUF1111 family)